MHVIVYMIISLKFFIILCEQCGKYFVTTLGAVRMERNHATHALATLIVSPNVHNEDITFLHFTVFLFNHKSVSKYLNSDFVLDCITFSTCSMIYFC